MIVIIIIIITCIKCKVKEFKQNLFFYYIKLSKDQYEMSLVDALGISIFLILF